MDTNAAGATPNRESLGPIIERFASEAAAFLRDLDDRPVLPAGAGGAKAAADRFVRTLPEQGIGPDAALEELLRDGADATASTAGPRCFHLVIGGATPAAVGADLYATIFDQLAYTWITSPIGVGLERLCIDWLKELFRLPLSWTGLLTTGATMANFVALASARQWWGEQHGLDVSENGMAQAPACRVLTSGHIHASSLKCLALLGVGRANCRKLAQDSIGTLDLDAMRRELEALEGAPAIVVANAGEVNAGAFDPIPEVIELARQHNTWVHVDGAFGLFARCSERTKHLVEGVERADSATVDGHKWLNVPYDCGFAFVRDHGLMARAFAYSADYLPDPDDERPTMGAIGPESSRRARSLPVWATLRAYGRDGYRSIIEGHLDLAQHLAGLVDAAENFERLAEVPLNIVCFRFNPGGRSEQELDDLNQRLGERILEDGRVFVGTTKYGGRTALRPAISNWRTRESDIDAFFAVVSELAAALA